ncbi:MAG: hypothetical protein K6G81_05490 [Lachnospiraceae bacterium]|nr:hypothetical protein [Lachnospiraceae bacterium]
MKRTVNPEVRKERLNAVKDTLKSMIFPTVVLIIIGIAVYFIVKYGAAVEDEPHVIPEAFEGDIEPITLENDQLLLTFYPETTQFDVTVKSSGKVWHSTAEGAESDVGALASEKGKLQSNILLNFTTQQGLDTLFDSFSFSVEKGIYSVEHDQDSITIHYSLGDIEREFIIPPIMLPDRYAQLTEGLSMTDKLYIDGNYKKIDLKKLKKDQNKDELLEQYPMLADGPIYVLSAASASGKSSVEAVLERLGYTREMYEEDKALVEQENVSDKPIFTADLILKLDGRDLVATVPMQSISDTNTYKVTTLTILPYFGAAGKNKEGFMLVPEGGGSLINYNNGRNSVNNYFSNIYGRDICLKKNDLVHDTRAYYNLFGMSEGDDSFICMLEQGASYAGIQADISGRVHSYNFVNALTTIRARERYDVGSISSSDIYGFNDVIPEEDLVQRYRFIDSGSYVDMAKVYGTYLKDLYGSAMTLHTDSEAPVVVDIVGAADKVKQICGIPVSRPLPLTTFEQAGDIVKSLKADGLNNLSIRLSGWCNGGVNQSVLNSIKPLLELGGKKGLKQFSKDVADMGVDLYLNGITEYAYDSNIFDGFFSYTDAAKIISKQRAELHIFSAVTYSVREATDSFYLLHPDLAFKMIDNLNAYAEKISANVSYEDVGKDLASDFYRKKPYSRETVKNVQAQKTKEISESGRKQMISMGCDYLAPYVDMMVEQDLSGSQYTILDTDIPFFQLAVHGYVDYTGEPLNICGNIEDELLYSAEYGAGLMFTVMNENAFTLQDTLYTKYYGCEYSNWRDRIKTIYNRFNSELGHTFNQEMTGHSKITEEVSCTEYADGTKVYVNYGFGDYTTEDGILISARDYKAVR